MQTKLREPPETTKDVIKRLQKENEELRVELGKVRRLLTRQRRKWEKLLGAGDWKLQLKGIGGDPTITLIKTED